MLQPWSCETCGAKGLARHQSDRDASQVLFQARREHWKADGCKGRLIFGERIKVFSCSLGMVVAEETTVPPGLLESSRKKSV